MKISKYVSFTLPDFSSMERMCKDKKGTKINKIYHSVHATLIMVMAQVRGFYRHTSRRLQTDDSLEILWPKSWKNSDTSVFFFLPRTIPNSRSIHRSVKKRKDFFKLSDRQNFYVILFYFFMRPNFFSRCFIPVPIKELLRNGGTIMQG